MEEVVKELKLTQFYSIIMSILLKHVVDVGGGDG